MPYEVLYVIQHANRICDWQENLLRDECPPSWMWSFEDELEVWFDQVEQARGSRYEGSSDDEDVDVPMTQNDLAKGRGR